MRIRERQTGQSVRSIRQGENGMNMVIQDGRRTYANRLNETPWKERLFMLFALIMFLHHIYTTVYFEVNNGVALFAAPWLLLALCNTVRGKLWKDPGAVFLFMLLAWKFVRLVPKGPDALKENAHVFFFCIYAFFGCYGLGKALKKESIQLFLKVFCAAWTISLLILCIMGIYVAWTGDEIANLGNKAVLIKENRLSMIYHWIEGGFLSSISLVVATIGFILCGKKAGKVFYVAAMAVIFLAGLLTMTRSAYAITAAEFAIILGILVHQRYKARASQNAEGKKRGWIRILAVIAASGIAMTGIQLIVVQEFNSLRNRVVINAEKADSTSENKQVETLTVRHIVNQKGVDMTLTGRTETWSNVFQVIRENPRILLWGYILKCLDRNRS